MNTETRQKLYDYLSKKHYLNLLENELDEIERILAKEFSFNDLEVWGSNSGETGIVVNHPEKGDESVYLKHIPTDKTGYVKLNI